MNEVDTVLIKQFTELKLYGVPQPDTLYSNVTAVRNPHQGVNVINNQWPTRAVTAYRPVPTFFERVPYTQNGWMVV